MSKIGRNVLKEKKTSYERFGLSKPKPVHIHNQEQLQALAKILGVRPDWHEPDEQDVTATVIGDHFDNAGVGNEKLVVVYLHKKPIAVINLATLLAMATGTYKGGERV